MVNIIKPIESDYIRKRMEHASQVLEIESIAWETEFYKKEPKKINATDLAFGFWEMQKEGKNTLRNWALNVGKRVGKTITKQGIDERLCENAVAMVKQILKNSLNQSNTKNKKAHKKELKKTKQEFRKLLSFFNNVILHDSTVQKVPEPLVAYFPGNRSNGKIRAVMRIQAVFNLTTERWMDLTVGSYAENDQSNANEIIGSLEKNDLLIRDLGYFTLDAISQLIENQYLITSWDRRTLLYQEDGKKIDLLSYLKENESVDLPVLVGKDKKIPMRMIARKLPKKEIERRIIETKKKSHADSNHSKEYYELLQYEIYLTNIPKTILNAEQIAKMYGLRWYIEILFKSWKSYFNFKTIFDKDRMSYERILISIYLVLIQFVYLTTEIYDYIRKQVEQPAQGCFISISKFMDVVNSFLSEILNIKNLNELDLSMPQFSKHSIYEKRKKRKNMKEKFQYFNELHISFFQT